MRMYKNNKINYIKTNTGYLYYLHKFDKIFFLLLFFNFIYKVTNFCDS